MGATPECVKLLILAQFDVPIGQIQKMFPAIVMLKAKVHLYERPPLRTLRLSNQVHARLERRAIRLLCIAEDARADNVLPRCRPTPLARDYVIEVKVFAIESLSTILAGVMIALENVVA